MNGVKRWDPDATNERRVWAGVYGACLAGNGRRFATLDSLIRWPNCVTGFKVG